MKALDRKLLRDLWQLKGQGLAIALVMACGVATFVMSLSTMRSLERTLTGYYERYRFADVFSHMKRAPEALAARIAEIPGVAQVQTRVVVDVSLDVPGLAEPAVGRLISVPDYQPPALDRLYLREGRMIEPGRTGEVVVSEGFAAAHKLKAGDTVLAVINGRRQQLRIVGTVLSPEYVYAIREGEMLPDEKRFGVFWMARTDLAAAFDMEGAFNDVALTLTPEAIEPEVLMQLDRLTEPYGGIGAYGRADQMSNRFISNEIEELRGMAIFAPLIFLTVAAFLLNVVISRLVGTQREQIAALKAFGYSNWEIGWHYLKFVLVLAVFGIALGTAAGAWLGRDMTALYTRFFHFPSFDYHLGVGVVLAAAGISLGASVLGTLNAVRRAVSLPPAEAMRPEPPANYRPTIVERLGLQRFLSPAVRMILRQIERQPIKAVISILGIALAVAVMVLGSYMKDAIEYAMDSQFVFAQRQDLTVTLIEPSSGETLFDFQHLPGVTWCEPFRATAVRLRHGPRSRRLGLLGLTSDAVLNHVEDVYRHPAEIPPDGLVLSAKLGEILNVRPGETVTLEVLEGERPLREMVVHSLVNDFAGVNAYMDIRALNRLMRDGNLISGAFLAADNKELPALYTELKNTPRVASVTIKQAAFDSFRQTLAENLLRMRLFNIIFASIIAFGVVYNSARISLSERSRELATLRVIGFTRGEISAILLGELAVLTVAAMPIGLVFGWLLALLISFSYDTELFRMPLIICTSTYAFSVIVVLAAAVISSLVVRRRLDHLDLVAVLKTKE